MDSERLVEKIQQRAYEIWLSKGCPPGQDLENWLQAEMELRSPQGAADLPAGADADAGARPKRSARPRSRLKAGLAENLAT